MAILVVVVAVFVDVVIHDIITDHPERVNLTTARSARAPPPFTFII